MGYIYYIFYLVFVSVRKTYYSAQRRETYEYSENYVNCIIALLLVLASLYFVRIPWNIC